MKNTTLCLITACLLLTFQPIQLKATNETPTTSVKSITTESAEATRLLSRLNYIDEIDKSNLKPSEKKKLRVEVRSIKHRLNDLGGGVYISVGAVIIIVLLLIILL